MTADGDDYLSRIVDEASLAAYLEEHLGPVDDYEVRHHQEGHSNETLFVTWGDRELVLRRPPPGETADTAHDVLREHHVTDALQGTDVRVPETVLACDDHDVLGCDFYLMERAAGDVLRESEPERFATLERRQRIGEELVDRLAEIHRVDTEAVGLDDIGHPEGYTERQVRRWREQFEWAFEVTAEERTVPKIAAVGDWLDDNVPDSHPKTLVHGDYKLDNVMFGPADDPEIVAIFDWELSTRGDPRFDLGWLLTYWRDAADPEPAIPELITRIPEREGYMTRRELVDRYEEAAGIEFDHGRFYRALAVYKLTALCEMFFRRFLEGNSDDPMYPKMRERVPALADWGKRIIDGDEPL
jgi:aminoglycoside phosphotransferase (APT) family kinase protein